MGDSFGLEAIKETLPTSMVSGSTEDRARGVLEFLLSEAIRRSGQIRTPVVRNPATCPNCGRPCASTRSPYCSAECREIASFVRSVRGGAQSGALVDQERQVALGQNMWFLLGGGRPLRQELVPERSRKQVIERAGGLCSVCGSAATTIDHIATGCNRPINLRAVCEKCCKARPFGSNDVLESDRAVGLFAELADR